MDGHVSRRHLLQSLVAISTVGGIPTSSKAKTPSPNATPPNSFDPVYHGFGFRNWNVHDQEFESPVENPTLDDIGNRIRTNWRGQARSLLGFQTDEWPNALVTTIATQMQGTIAQRAGTNGHCYGMSLAAQRYYEQPETVPVDMELAAEIEHPTVPLDEPDKPVLRDIVTLQSQQFTNFRSWFSRRAMLWPEQIDVAAQLRDITAVVDVFDTASITLIEGRQGGHQVVVFDYDEHEDGMTLHLYDPNRNAQEYNRIERKVNFQQSGETMLMIPYGRYTHMLFNRYDRIAEATGRESASALDHLDISPEGVREELFPTALVTVNTPSIDLSVSRPNRGVINRINGRFMDRTQWSFPRMRYGYGISPGEYTINVVGQEDTPYELRVRIASTDGMRLDATEIQDIERGETHVYTATVPNSANEEGNLELNTSSSSGLLRQVGAGVAGVAIGGTAAHLWHRHREA